YLPRWILLSVVCVPFAILVGYLLAVPVTSSNLAVLGLLFGVVAFPLIVRWHHAAVIFTWNAYLIVFFLPGQPNLGITLAAGSLLFSLVNRTLRNKNTFIEVPSLKRSLMFLGIVVIVTSICTGGIGGRVFGTESWGAKRYGWLFGALLGYF